MLMVLLIDREAQSVIHRLQYDSSGAQALGYRQSIGGFSCERRSLAGARCRGAKVSKKVLGTGKKSGYGSDALCTST